MKGQVGGAAAATTVEVLLLEDTQAFQAVFLVRVPPPISPVCMVLDVLFNLYAPHFFISKTSILFTHKKEINTDIYYNMDEPQKHYAM